MTSEDIIKNNEIDLMVIIKLLLNKKLHILSVSLLFMVVGFFYTLSLPNFYESTLKFYSNVSDSSPSELDKIRGVVNSFGFSDLGSSDQLSILDIVKSRSFKELLVDKEWVSKKYNNPINLIGYWEIDKVEDNHSFNPVVWIKYLFSIPAKLINASATADLINNIEDIGYEWKLDALNKLSSRLNIVESNTGVYSIAILMEEPQLSADIANYIYELLLEFYANDYLESARRNKEFIADRKLEVLEKLELAEENLKEFRQRNRKIVESPHLQLEFGRLQRDVALQTQIFLTLSEQLELAKIKELNNKPTIDILDKAIPPIDKKQPSRTKIVLMCMLLGVGMGSVFVLTKATLQN